MKFRWLTFVVILGSCTPSQERKPANTSTVVAQTAMDSLQPIAEVLAAHTETWMQIPGVTGTGETKKDGKPAILILVDSLTDSVRSHLPSEVEGYPVVIQQSGEIRTLPAK